MDFEEKNVFVGGDCIVDISPFSTYHLYNSMMQKTCPNRWLIPKAMIPSLPSEPANVAGASLKRLRNVSAPPLTARGPEFQTPSQCSESTIDRKVTMS